jgi:hypothetical protein
MSRGARPPSSGYGYPSYDWGFGQPNLAPTRSPMLPPPPPPSTPANALVAEDGTTFLVAEDGVTFLVQET